MFPKPPSSHFIIFCGRSLYLRVCIWFFLCLCVRTNACGSVFRGMERCEESLSVLNCHNLEPRADKLLHKHAGILHISLEGDD